MHSSGNFCFTFQPYELFEEGCITLIMGCVLVNTPSKSRILHMLVHISLCGCLPIYFQRIVLAHI